jgi:uncharacterized protein (TIGR02452 family)
VTLLKEIAAANEAIITAGYYATPAGRTVRLAEKVAAACRGTVSYGPATLDDLVAAAGPGNAATVVEVTGESTMSAARRLLGGGASEVTVLNFASARKPGGGYLGGARAQEEDLCRVSALYTTLLRAPDFYAAHRADPDPAYSHRVIYSPGVPVYRDDGYRLLDEPYHASFVTCAAPNAGAIARSRPGDTSVIPGILQARAARVLAVAARHRGHALVLGAWGCGVFRNDPARVAAAFRASLTRGRFAGVFNHITFAVLDHLPGQPNLAAFRATFGQQP